MSYFDNEEAIKIKQKTIFVLLIVVLIITAINIYKSIFDVNNEFDTKMSEKIKKANYYMEQSLNNLRYEYNAKANYLSMETSILQVLQQKDKEALYQYTKPRFELFKDENRHLVTMQFVDTNNKSILKLHDVNNDINTTYTRQIVQDASQNVSHLAGFEMCSNGLLYRVINPLFLHNEYVGMLEFGISPKYFIDKIEKIIDIKSAILAPTAILCETDIHSSPVISDYALLDNSQFFAQIIKLYPNLLEKNNYKISIGDRVYFVNHTDLAFVNHKGDKVGKILVLNDITNDIYEYKYNIINTVALNILTVMIIMIFIHFGFDYLINNLKILNKEILFSKVYFQSLFNAQPNIIIVTNNTDIIDANKAFLNFVGYKSLNAFKVDYQSFSEIFEQKININKKMVIDKDIIAKIICSTKISIVKDDSEYIYDIVQTHIEIDNEVRNIITLTDITKIEKYNENLQKEIQNTETKLKKANEEIIKQSKLKNMTEMISMIAHQWRQPLSKISSLAGSIKIGLMLDNMSKDYIDKTIDEIANITHSLSNIISSFNEYLRPTSNEAIYVSLQSIVDEAIQKSKIHQSILVTKHTDTINIQIYKNELVQVLVNIIENAQDAIHKTNQQNPVIELSAYKSGDNVVFEVADNGGGISDEVVAKIFEPYFSTKSKNDNGLGLYISKLIVENHLNGTIEYYNNQFGATFIITL